MLKQEHREGGHNRGGGETAAKGGRQRWAGKEKGDCWLGWAYLASKAKVEVGQEASDIKGHGRPKGQLGALAAKLQALGKILPRLFCGRAVQQLNQLLVIKLDFLWSDHEGGQQVMNMTQSSWVCGGEGRGERRSDASVRPFV